MNVIEQWFRDDGDRTHRLNYDLNKDSIVFDVGGYKGWFTEQINNMYHSRIYCFEPIQDYYFDIQRKFNGFGNISVFPLAISDKNGVDVMYINDDSSSIHIKTGNPFKIDCITLDKVMWGNGLNYIDLIKINIEGEEYTLLEYMIKNNLVEKCENIQVQFHTFIEDYKLRYDVIKCELEKTHYITYSYPFVWENWKIKDNVRN